MDKRVLVRINALEELRKAQDDAKRRQAPYITAHAETFTRDEWVVTETQSGRTSGKRVMTGKEFMRLVRAARCPVYINMLPNVEWFYIYCCKTLPKLRGYWTGEWTEPQHIADFVAEHPHVSGIGADPETHAVLIEALEEMPETWRLKPFP